MKMAIVNDRTYYTINRDNCKPGEFKLFFCSAGFKLNCHFKDHEAQGEYISYYENGNDTLLFFFNNSQRHGEYKLTNVSLAINDHKFFYNGKDITSEIEDIVNDIDNIAPDEKVIIELKYGIGLLK